MIDLEIEIKDDTSVSSLSSWFCGGIIYWGISCGNGKVWFLMVKCLWNMNIKISKWQVFYKPGVHRIREQGYTFESSQYTIF